MGETTSRQGATSPHYSQTASCINAEIVRFNGTGQKSQPVILQSKPIFEDYTDYKPNRQPTEFEHDGKTYKCYLPDKVLDFFNDEFDYRELANWQDLQNLAMAYFTLITSPYEVTSGGGGGGSQSDLNGDVTLTRTRLSLPVVVRVRLRTGSAHIRNLELNANDKDPININNNETTRYCRTA